MLFSRRKKKMPYTAIYCNPVVWHYRYSSILLLYCATIQYNFTVILYHRRTHVCKICIYGLIYYMHKHIYKYIYTHIYVYVYICVYIYTYIYISVCVYTYIHIYIHIYIYAHIYNICIYICIYPHTRILRTRARGIVSQ